MTLTRYMTEELGVPGIVAGQIGFKLEPCKCTNKDCAGVKIVFSAQKHVTIGLTGPKIEDVEQGAGAKLSIVKP